MPPDQNSKANSITQKPTKLARAEYTCALWNYNYRRNHQPIKGNSECWKKERKKRKETKSKREIQALKNQQKGWAEPGLYCPTRLYTSVQQLEQLSNSVLCTRCSSWLFHLVAYVPWIGVRDGSAAIPKMTISWLSLPQIYFPTSTFIR